MIAYWLNIMKLMPKSHSMPVYDQKDRKAKVREFNGVSKTKFLGV